MPKLPVVSGREAVKAFQRAGWFWSSQVGDHVTLDKEGSRYVITIPLHREVAKGILRGAIRKAGMTVEEFRKLLG